MEKQLTFRAAETSDLPDLLNLYRQLGEDDGSVLTADEAVRIFTKIDNYPDYCIYLAIQDDQVIGTFALLIMDNLGHCGAKSAILEDIVIDEQRRGQGFGRMMLHYAHELCRQKECYKLVVNSNKNRHRAHNFYGDLGYQQHGISFFLQNLNDTSAKKHLTGKNV